jgi:hypothetical protein
MGDGRTDMVGWWCMIIFIFGELFCALITWFRCYQRGLRHDFWFLGTGA